MNRPGDSSPHYFPGSLAGVIESNLRLHVKVAVFLTVLLTGVLSYGLIVMASPDTGSNIKTVYITPTSHYDFGFVDPPDQIRERVARHLDAVLQVAEAHPTFRWTIESVWQVNEWLKRAKQPTSILPKDTEKINRLMNRIKSGQIEISSVWGSMHTDFMGSEELNLLCYDMASLKRRYGISSELAVMDDIPGHPISIPSVLSDSGVKYLLVGANLFFVGGTSLAPGKVPFYWEGMDGRKVLTWVSQGAFGGYTEALADFCLDPYSLDPYGTKPICKAVRPNETKEQSDLEILDQGVAALLKRYGDAGYAYDSVLVIWAHDFIEPGNVLNLERAVSLWNEKRGTPHLKIATPSEFFRTMEAKYGSQLQTFRGEWSGLWSEAKLHSAQMTAMAKATHDQLPSLSTLWSALATTLKVPFPMGNFSRLYDLLYTYDEHSGAGNLGWPQLNTLSGLEEQNRQYVGYLRQIQKETDELKFAGLKSLAEGSGDREVIQHEANSEFLIVYNPLSWARSDIVRIPSPVT